MHYFIEAQFRLIEACAGIANLISAYSVIGWVVLILGVVVTIVTMLACIKGGFANEYVIIAFGWVCIIVTIWIWYGGETGKAKTTIDVGYYAVVGKSEVIKEEQAYFHFILKQNDGKEVFYTLPQSIIIVKEVAGKEILEVVEKKSGFKQIILYTSTH